MPDTLKNCIPGTYVYNFKCTNQEILKLWTNDASMSFFSGHALVGAYAAFFLVFYFQIRMKKHNFIRSFIQIILVFIAYFIGISRVFDQRHWPTDVAVGGILGILFAIHAWLIQCKNFKFENLQKIRTEILPLNQN